MTASQIQSILYFPRKTPVIHWFYIAQGSQENFASRKKNLRAVICVNLDERWMKNECISSTKLKIRYSILIFFYLVIVFFFSQIKTGIGQVGIFPSDEHELIFFIDPQVHSRCDMFDSHWMVPIDISSTPFDSGQF